MMNPLTAFPYKINPFGNSTLLGRVTGRSTKKTEAFSYVRGKEKAIAKRRANNKVARKSRRYNRLHAGKKHCKFYAKG